MYMIHNCNPTWTMQLCWPTLVMQSWQQSWNENIGNKLLGIRPLVGGFQHKGWLSRSDAILIVRLWIGHTRLTHFYLHSGRNCPECSACQCHNTDFNHIFLYSYIYSYILIFYILIFLFLLPYIATEVFWHSGPLQIELLLLLLLLCCCFNERAVWRSRLTQRR